MRALIMILLVSACGQLTKKDKKPGSELASVLQNQGLSVELKEPSNDAFDYTFGAQGILLQRQENKGDAIETTNMVYLGSEAAVTDEQKAALGSLCQNMGLSLSAREFAPASSLPKDNGLLYIHWRSHFSVQEKNGLSSALEQLKTSMRCVLKINVGGSDSGQVAYIALDPIPADENAVTGTSNLLQAIEEGLMLIEENPALLLNHSQLWPVEAAASILPLVSALNSADFQVQLNTSSGSNCVYQVVAGASKLTNPDSKHSYLYDLKGSKTFNIGTIDSQSISGRLSPTCESLKPKALGKQVQNEVGCSAYLALMNEGLEAGCRWSVELANPKDAGNSLGYTISMQKIAFETIDITTVRGAAAVLPEAPNNPVRAQTTVFQGFNAAQLTSMEQSFDFWIAASPISFKTYFEKLVTRVTYLARTGADCSIMGVLAYVVSLNSPEIFWCEAAGMSANAVLATNSPLQILLISVTAFHEDLHTRGREHDFDAPQYLPCKGTAESALLPFDAIKTCTDDYCRPFKDYALQEYRIELDYSLQGDPRRFQGQCQIWNTGLGLKSTDFRT